MSRTTAITCAAIIEVMAKPHHAAMTLAEIGACFGIGEEGMRYHIKKLLEAGDVYRVRTTHGRQAAQFSVVSRHRQYVGDIVQPFKTTAWTPPLYGYEAGLRSFADLAMSTRRA